MNAKVEAFNGKNEVNKDQEVQKSSADGVYTLKDSLGRTIKFKKPSARTKLYFKTFFSPNETKSDVFMADAFAFIYVCGIDDVVIAPLMNKADFDVLVDLLGDAGVAAAHLGYVKFFAKENIEVQANLEAEIKKLL